MSKDVFVVRHGDGWGVRTAGARHVAKSFETKAPAFEYGRSMALKLRNGVMASINFRITPPLKPHHWSLVRQDKLG